jgi:hypothetical protein
VMKGDEWRMFSISLDAVKEGSGSVTFQQRGKENFIHWQSYSQTKVNITSMEACLMEVSQ